MATKNFDKNNPSDDAAYKIIKDSEKFSKGRPEAEQYGPGVVKDHPNLAGKGPEGSGKMPRGTSSKLT